MNVPNEICVVPKVDEHSSGKSGGKTLLIIGPVSHVVVNGHHLFVAASSIITGGIRGRKYIGKIMNQIPHNDNSRVMIDSVEYSVSNNPHLKGLCPPVSISIPLSEFRDIYQYQNNTEVLYWIWEGEGHVFAGDCTHGGVTCDPPANAEKVEWRPALHLSIGSVHHQNSNLDTFEVDIDAVAHSFPQLLPRLDQEAQMAAMNPIGDRCFQGYHSLLSHQVTNENDSSIKSSIRDLIVCLESLIIGPDSKTTILESSSVSMKTAEDATINAVPLLSPKKPRYGMNESEVVIDVDNQRSVRERVWPMLGSLWVKRFA